MVNKNAPKVEVKTEVKEPVVEPQTKVEEVTEGNTRFGIYDASTNERILTSKSFDSIEAGEEYLEESKHERTTSNIPNQKMFIHSETGALLVVCRYK